jgi:hypothetical protein
MLLSIAGWWVSFITLFFFILQVDCLFPPSDKIGINSVQRENEEILPMKAMKMAWVPYVPLEDRYFYVIILSDICSLWFSLLTYTFCRVIRTYISHFGIALFIGSAGLIAWKQKYSLSVAPSEGQLIYEFTFLKFHALRYIFSCLLLFICMEFSFSSSAVLYFIFKLCNYTGHNFTKSQIVIPFAVLQVCTEASQN